MSSERDRKAVSEAEVIGLLRRLGQAPVDEPATDEREDRDARLAVRLDAEVAQLSRARRQSRRSLAWLVAFAAALPLGLWAVRAARGPGSVVALEREPVPSGARLSPSAPSPTPSVPNALAARAATQVDLRPKIVERTPPAPFASSAPVAAGAAPSVSTLGEENRLFREAVNDAHAGSVDRALHGFEQLLHDYPRSPLAQTALVRKFRVLSAAGRDAEARVEARRYLQAYPSGFAQGEARAVASGQTPPNTTDAGNDPEAP